MSCCFTPLDDGVPAGGSTPGTLVAVSHEIDWSAQGNVTLTDGPHTIVDTEGNAIAHTSAGAAGAATWRLQSGAGLEFIANATSTTFNSGTTTAAHIYATYAALFAAWDVDPTWVLTVRNYMSVFAVPTNNSSGGGPSFGVWGVTGTPNNSAARLRIFRKLRAVNVIVAQMGIDAGGSGNRVSAAIDAADVIGYINAPGTVSGIYGVYNGAWLDSRITAELALDATTSNNPNTFRDETVRNVLAFPSAGISADMRVTVERTRFDFAPLVSAA